MSWEAVDAIFLADVTEQSVVMALRRKVCYLTGLYRWFLDKVLRLLIEVQVIDRERHLRLYIRWSIVNGLTSIVNM